MPISIFIPAQETICESFGPHQSEKRIAFQHMQCDTDRKRSFRHEDNMVPPSSTRSAGAKLQRTETVSIRLDPRLNYLCELAARSQRRTKSSFIEAAIDEKIQSMSITNWRDTQLASTLGERADFLWHVREHERLISLGLVAPHLMTFEEQQIWATISEHAHFWRGQWVRDGHQERWVWSREDSSILRDRVEEWWETIVKVAHGELDKGKLPQIEPRAAPKLNDDVPF